MKQYRLILALGCMGVLAGTCGLLSYNHTHPPMHEIILTDDNACRAFLAEYGRTTTETPPMRSEIILPMSGTSPSPVYTTYCMLQESQQLPLSKYAGQDAVRLTYALTDSKNARAELICTPDGLLLGAICYDCTRFDHMYAILT